ncbi:MAG: hypothetical protein ACYDBB_02605 [Armatimonadota bacterium]
MALVTDAERAQIIADVRALILASEQQAVLSRAVSGARLYGADEAEYAPLGAIPVECVPTPPEELAQKIDAKANVLPEDAVQTQDRLLIDGVTYRVQAIREERWFGVVTHQVLSLVRLHGC